MNARLPLWQIIAFLLLVGGCSNELPHAPDSAGPGAPEIVSLASLSSSGEMLLALEPGTDPLALVLEYGLVLLEHDATAALAVVSGVVDANALLVDTRVTLGQSNTVTVFSEPEDVTQGFHQGDWPDEEIAAQSALGLMHIPSIFPISRGKGVLVAVLDTGADLNHPHLAGRLRISAEIPADMGQSEGSPDGIDQDTDGTPDEAYGHGTHVSGLVLTVAPDSEVLPIRIMNDDGIGTAYDLCRGMYYARELGAKILNLSLVLSNDSPVVDDFLGQMQAAGIAVVAAAGNDPATVGYPASDPRVLSVAASNDQDILANFSGRAWADISAPGVALESAYPGGGSAISSGTSMASPIVCGTLALVMQSPQSSTALGACGRLKEFAIPLAFGPGIAHGRISPLHVLKGQGMLAEAAAN